MTAREVRYGVSRLFAPALRSRGLEPVRSLLAVPAISGPLHGDHGAAGGVRASRRGVLRRDDRDLPPASVGARLRPVAALPAFGPVPAAKDTGLR